MGIYAKASALALRLVPSANVTFTSNGAQSLSAVHIGIVDGTRTLAVSGADLLTPSQIAKTLSTGSTSSQPSLYTYGRTWPIGYYPLTYYAG